MIEGQRGGKQRLAGLEVDEGVVVREQAIGGSAEGRILESQGRVGSVTPGRVGTRVLVRRQSGRRGESGSRRQGTSQIQLSAGVGTCIVQRRQNKGSTGKHEGVRS